MWFLDIVRLGQVWPLTLRQVRHVADAQAGLRLCCSQPTKTGFLATRPI